MSPNPVKPKVKKLTDTLAANDTAAECLAFALLKKTPTNLVVERQPPAHATVRALALWIIRPKTPLPSPTSLKLHQQIPRRHQIPRLNVQLRNPPIPRRIDGSLHLHRLNRQQFRPLL